MGTSTAIAPSQPDKTPSPRLSQVNQFFKLTPELKNVLKANQIAPTGPTIEQLKLESKKVLGHRQSGSLSFRDAFGVLGLPMLIVLVTCVVWTAWLVFLALAPNQAANLLMHTQDYDNGEFWMISDANPGMAFTGAIGLMLVCACYVVVTLRMIFYREKLVSSALSSYSSTWWSSGHRSMRWLSSMQPHYERGQLFYNDLTNFEGKNRKRWNALLKLGDLGIESVMLRQLLLSGSPATLTYGFTIFLALNAMSCVINVLTDRFSALTEIFIYSVFDLSAAVLYPIVTLVYCYYNFSFDRAVYLTYLEMLPAGSFEEIARSFVDQSELALFRVNFDNLRIDSLLDFVLRIGMNLSFCYRFERLLGAILWTRQRERIFKQIKQRSASESELQNPVPKSIVAVFIACSLVVLLSANKAMTDSTTLCSAYPECVVYAHQWETSEKTCPCLYLIDVDRAPKTYEEWINPIDAYDTVKALASSGLLKSLQVINRQLVEFPEELRLCRGLKVIQLMYTSTQYIPSWMKELKNLESIQVEGKYGQQNLVNLPEDLFADLPRLSMLHFGLHEHIDHIPPLSGVPQLRSLSLAWLTRLHDLPSFNHIPSLGRLILALLPSFERLPDMAPLQNLLEFDLLRPNHICCNGFMGACNLSHISCQSYPFANVSAATCLMNDSDPNVTVTPFLGYDGTRKVFEKFASTICQASPFDSPDFLSFPVKATIEICGGKPYRQCFLPGNLTGICYNARFAVLSCLPDEHYIALRRLQIAKKIGPKCDPVEEEWLGCD